MKIIYMGHNKRGIACLEALKKSKHEIQLVVAQEGEEGWYVSIKKAAENLGLPVISEHKPNSEEFLEKVRKLAPDLIILCGYSKIIGKKLRSIPLLGCVNLHASKLPFYRGAAPLNWALINNEKEIGLSIYFVDEGIDTGDIISQDIFQIDSNTTINEVQEIVLERYPKLLLKTLDQFENGEVKVTKQNLDEGSYYTKRYPQDGLIDFSKCTDVEIHNMVRALTKPYPGAFFMYKNKKIFVWKTKLLTKNCYGISGRIQAKKGGLIVIAKNRGIQVDELESDDGLVDSKEFFKVGEDLV